MSVIQHVRIRYMHKFDKVSVIILFTLAVHQTPPIETLRAKTMHNSTYTSSELLTRERILFI